MNSMFKRIAALLERQALHQRPAWLDGPAKPASEQALACAELDFRDTDIAVAWLCEASNKTWAGPRENQQAGGGHQRGFPVTF
jgi:hypothetical protein